MSDTQPVLPPTAPPTYTESQSTATGGPYVQNPPPQFEPPPPYTTPPYPAATGASYQRLDPVVVNQVEILSVVRLGPQPCQVKCQNCHQIGVTIIKYRAGLLTFLMALLCFLFCIICTFLPFCVGDLQDVAHFCPHCGYHIGTYTRL